MMGPSIIILCPSNSSASLDCVFDFAFFCSELPRKYSDKANWDRRMKIMQPLNLRYIWGYAI